MKSFCIIGLGNFGKNLALTLAQNGNQVLVIDNVESDIDAIADHVTNAVCGDPTNEMVLRAAGVASYGCCVVCLGSDNMQESILVTLTLKELGIPKIVARASSEQHRKVLTRSARIWSCSLRRIWAESWRIRWPRPTCSSLSTFPRITRSSS